MKKYVIVSAAFFVALFSSCTPNQYDNVDRVNNEQVAKVNNEQVAKAEVRNLNLARLDKACNRVVFLMEQDSLLSIDKGVVEALSVDAKIEIIEGIASRTKCFEDTIGGTDEWIEYLKASDKIEPERKCLEIEYQIYNGL